MSSVEQKPNALISLSLGQILSYDYVRDKNGNVALGTLPSIGFADYPLSKSGTYAIAFGRNNKKQMEYFLSKADVNFLFKSEGSVNGFAGHNIQEGPVLTLVIFEVDKDGPIKEKNEQSVEVQPVSEVPGARKG